MGPSGGSVKNSLTSSSATVQVSDREISGFEHVAIFSRPARSVNSLHLFSYQIISQDKFFPAGQPTAGLRPSPRAAPAGTFPVGTMSLLGTSTSLRSVTGCRVAESEVPPITTNPVSPGRRRWHGISRASATTSSPQAVAESGRYCLPRRCLVIRHGTRERAGDNEEHRDEVMAVSTTPVQYEKQGHDVSGGYTPERTFCPIKHIRLNRRTRKHLGDKAQRPWQWCDRSQESRSLSAIVIPG